VLWSELRHDPPRLAAELAKLGISRRVLKADVRDVPELRSTCNLLTGDALLVLALEWFGDEGHPQPAQRTVWQLGRTPDWGRLPPLEDDELPPVEEPQKNPRYRPPEELERDKVKQLMFELAQREAELGGGARVLRGSEFTQEKIAARLGWDRTRVQQAESLQRLGWELLRSHPQFSALDEFVRWPSVDEAAQILASERRSRRRRRAAN
jgi:hypothetical protein